MHPCPIRRIVRLPLVSAAYNLGPGAVCNVQLLVISMLVVCCLLARTLLALNRSLGVPRAGLYQADEKKK